LTTRSVDGHSEVANEGGAVMGRATTDTADTATAAELMRRAFDALGRRDLDDLASLWDDRSVDAIVALQREVVGERELRAFFGEVFTALPDLRFEVEAIHPVDDHTAVGQWRLTGTFTGGPFQGIEPTGRCLDLRGVDVMRFEDGWLRRNDIYYDGLTFARQIGLLPAADSNADRGMLSAFNALARARHAWTARRSP
jgi:steroid delta-isomerase-like uncharacterized protein